MLTLNKEEFLSFRTHLRRGGYSSLLRRKYNSKNVLEPTSEEGAIVQKRI